VPVVDKFIADLKDAVKEARIRPSGKGTMVALYGTRSTLRGPPLKLIYCVCPIGLGNSSAVGPSMVGELAASFLDALYKA
jgi:sphinganine-1-phosphate aldolase